MRSWPVKQVAIQPAGLQACERPLARDLGPLAGGILWHHLGDEEYLITPVRNGVADHLLRGAGAVHFGSVDVSHSEVDAPSQRGDGGSGAALLDVPGPLADDADLALQRTEPSLRDGGPRAARGIMRHDVARLRH